MGSPTAEEVTTLKAPPGTRRRDRVRRHADHQIAEIERPAADP
ncbi:hypothetical protein ABZ754_17775 [Micromonospora purpureochromogenes]